MKITEVNLTIPHYVILISATRNQCLVTKTELSAVEQGSWDTETAWEETGEDLTGVQI